MAALDTRRLRVLITGGAEARRALSARLSNEECDVVEVQERGALLQMIRGGEVDLAVVEGPAADAELLALVRQLSTEGRGRPVVLFRDPVAAGLQDDEQVRQARKMETLGRLTAGIVHDFNNLLTVMMSCNELLLMDTPTDDPRRGLLRELSKAAERSAALTRKLLAFGRKQTAEPLMLDLNAIVKEMEPTLRRLLPADISLEFSLQRHLGRILADPVQIEQVLLNLVLNARDAMPTGGRLRIATADADTSEDASGPRVVLRVSDSGCGMEPATLDRLFEPFFTTKAVGRGSGLGLVTVQQVVRQSGGTIEVSSTLGSGTSFAVSFPGHPAAVLLGPSAVSTPHLPRGSETVLLAEDDDTVRKLWVQTLEDLGYRVLAVADGRQALATAEALHQPVHLFVGDIDLPGLDGGRVAEKLQTRWPLLRVLLLTGHAEEVLARRSALPAGMSILRKPFPPSVLTRKLREILDGGFVEMTA